MFKLFAALLLAGPLTACATTDAPDSESDFPVSDQASKPSQPLPPIGADQEYSFFQGQTHTFSFPGFFSPQAETFFIWNFGTTIQHGAPYPSSDHGRLYGVFAPGPAGATHHVDGQDGFDHYHVMSQNAGTRTFDVFLVFPGPSFNAATFDAPLSEHDINDAVAAGVLAAPITTTAAGFGPLVITVPVTKLKGH
ncbi:MAG: hypothetical protein ABIY55_06055 [Kofleriaceae bacterium]